MEWGSDRDEEDAGSEEAFSLLERKYFFVVESITILTLTLCQ
jgi:hypothetical protein